MGARVDDNQGVGTDEGPAATDLRTRTRHAVRREIETTAMRLFLDHGFDDTTMEQIAREVGMSRRSLFRYFPSKEDIVLGQHAHDGEVLRAALANRPADEGLWDAIRAALKVLVDDLPYSSSEFLRITTMLHASTVLRARHLEKRQQWLDVLEPVAIERLGHASDPTVQLHARAILASALSCAEVATEMWVQSNGRLEMEAAFDQAVTAVRSKM